MNNWALFTRPHSIISQKAVYLIIVVLRNLNPKN